MSVFDLDTEGQAAVADEAQANAVRADQLTPGFWDNSGLALLQGVMRGGAKVGQFVGMMGAAPLALLERAPGSYASPVEGFQSGDLTDRYFRALDEYVNSAVDYWTPDAATTGTAGKVLGGLSEITLPLLATAGNPALLVGTQEVSGATELSRQGVEPLPALAVGTVQGVANALGVKVPFLGKALASKMLSGALGNLAVNEGASKVSEEILADTGHEALAREFSPNGEGVAVDVLSGLVFGALAHAQTPSIRDAAATVANAKHFQEDTAPGVPADINASVAHQNALESAIHDVLSGKPVDLSGSKIAEAQFTPRPVEKVEVPKAFADLEKTDELPALKESAIPRDSSLSAADRAVESKFASQLESDVDRAIREYAQVPGSENGKILNTDLARELSADYRADRTRSAAVHEPASWLVKQMYARMLAQAPKADEEPVVVMSAGGTGAGKTTGLNILRAESPLFDRAQIIYDTNMNGLESSAQKIDQALNAGKDVEVVYTYRDPVESLSQGALPRAMSKGRTVPLVEHARTHVGAASTIKELAKRYEGDSRVRFTVIDNTRGKGQATKGDLSSVPNLEYNRVREDLSKALEAERKAGTISEAIYRGTAGREAQLEHPTGSVRGSDHQGPERAPGPVLDPVVTAAQQAVAEADFQVPTGELNPDGTPQTVSAREFLAKAREDVVKAEQDAKAFDAIAGCILTRGEG